MRSVCGSLTSTIVKYYQVRFGYGGMCEYFVPGVVRYEYSSSILGISIKYEHRYTSTAARSY